jgi:hypothetical protein
LLDGRTHFTLYPDNWFGHEHTSIASLSPLPNGDVQVGVRFDYDGGGLGKGGALSVTVTVNGESVADGDGSSEPCRSSFR